MRPDLQDLVISEDDFKAISGIDSSLVVAKVPTASITERLLLITSSVISAYLAIWIRMSMTNEADLRSITAGSSFLVGLMSGITVFIGITLILNYQRRSDRKQRRELETLRKLLLEIYKYNDVVRMIDVKDQLEAVGHSINSFNDRDKVVQALQLAKSDFTRALKTERILRENQDLIAQHPVAFQSNLTAIQALQVNDQGSEWGQVLSQALLVAVEVQEEMRRLQGRL
ncbi:hypothetical protein [Pantanalinema sp. GBBB05]|uniref:hypothetical protein n=1 Tax=Pantanalinema sp. GBBB05 TaxID=2604139 RepID=UPI001DD385E6|nr:hypothetical protein [Pantanalinema sp. GBBB05]